MIICTDTGEVVKTYSEYLHTKHWRTLRIAIAKARGYKCEKCGKLIKRGFHIHHKSYSCLGRENLTRVMFLCKGCHNKIHIHNHEPKYKLMPKCRQTSRNTVRKRKTTKVK